MDAPPRDTKPNQTKPNQTRFRGRDRADVHREVRAGRVEAGAHDRRGPPTLGGYRPQGVQAGRVHWKGLPHGHHVKKEEDLRGHYSGGPAPPPVSTVLEHRVAGSRAAHQSPPQPGPWVCMMRFSFGFCSALVAADAAAAAAVALATVAVQAIAAFRGVFGLSPGRAGRRRVFRRADRYVSLLSGMRRPS